MNSIHPFDLLYCDNDKFIPIPKDFSDFVGYYPISYNRYDIYSELDFLRVAHVRRPGELLLAKFDYQFDSR